MADDFIQQMDEERRIQRLRVVMRRAGSILLAILLIGGVSGSIWGWQRHRLHVVQQKASGRCMQALSLLDDKGGKAPDSAAQEKATALLADLSAHGPQGVQAYARARLADVKASHGDVKAALTLWDTQVHDEKAEPALRDLARYLWLNAQMNTLSPDILKKGYQNLAQEGGSWAPLAWEGLAALDLRAGSSSEQRKEAHRLLLQIESSSDTSDALRERTRLLLQTLGDAG